MAKVIYAARALLDLERPSDFLREKEPDLAPIAVARIREVISVLAEHPYLGRPVESGLRELVISKGSTGYVALYSVNAENDVVFVLGVRHQRDAGLDEPH